VFNLSWASCQVVTFWVMALFMTSVPAALLAIPVLGASHVLAMALIPRLRPEPAPHGEGGHPHSARETARYRELLGRHRLLLILSYVAFSALNPLLPSILGERLRVADHWATPLTSVWMIARVASFWFMGAWGGWHGRGATLVWPATLLLLGLGLSLLATNAWMLGAGLALFGAGMGAIYSAAFYYAMEVGSAGVDAGGKHEAFIGMGYTLGPVVGVGAGGLIAAGVAGPESRSMLTLVCVLGVVGAGAAIGFWKDRRSVG
jgi:MFS family permease